MDIPTVTAIGAIVVAVVSAILTYRSSSQANRTAEQKVDAEAYDRAQGIWERALDQSDKQIERLRQQVERLERQVQAQAELETLLRDQIRELKATVSRMERQNAQLRTMLRSAGISVPESGDGESEAV